ncbi:MAG: TadE/TadG family type IV pilus assembly protein [Pirellulales bacterium]
MGCRGRAWRRGAAVAEFAVVAPVFFMMIIGFIEFGRALMVQQVLVNASRVGAREAIIEDATTSTVTGTVQDYAEGVSVSGVSVTVTPDPATADTSDFITVTVSIGFDDVSWMPTPWFMGGKSLSASSTMRKEGFY